MRRRHGALIVAVGLLAAGCEGGGQTGLRTSTTAYGKGGEQLTIVKPFDQQIHRGGTETMTINLKRNNMHRPVRVSFAQLPAGVEAVDTPRATSANNLEVVLRASESADLVAGQCVYVTAEGPDGMRATETFNVTVRQRS